MRIATRHKYLPSGSVLPLLGVSPIIQRSQPFLITKSQEGRRVVTHVLFQQYGRVDKTYSVEIRGRRFVLQDGRTPESMSAQLAHQLRAAGFEVDRHQVRRDGPDAWELRRRVTREHPNVWVVTVRKG